MSGIPVEAVLSPEAVELIAARAAELVAERNGAAEPWIGVQQAADHLGCGTSRIYTLISAKRIPHEKDGSRVVFKASDLDAWVRSGGGTCP